jgi:hypothetical protein
LIVWIRARTGMWSPNSLMDFAPSMMIRASVPSAAYPTKITLQSLWARLWRRWWRTRPPVHMPEPAMITAPARMRFSAIDSDASRVKCSSGRRKGILAATDHPFDLGLHRLGVARKICVAEIAMGESRKTCVAGPDILASPCPRAGRTEAPAPAPARRWG